MSSQTDRLNQLIAELCKLPLPGLAESEIRQVYDLLKRYFRHIQLDDLANETQRDILGGVVAHWQLMRERKPGTPKVRIYNPNFEEHGWQSRQTIIEISTDDQAFLVDSLTMALNRAGIAIDLTIHSLINVSRDAKGFMQGLFDSDDERGTTESLIRFQVEKQLSPEQLESVQAELKHVLKVITRTNADWTLMQERVNAIRERSTEKRPPVEAGELAEADEMLKWIVENHFTFLGYCELDLSSTAENGVFAITSGTSLGVLTGEEDTLERLIPLEIGRHLETGCYMVITKANQRSLVHRPAYMDFISVKRFNSQGELDGQFCIFGLFAATAYTLVPKEIPVLKRKVNEVLEGTGLMFRSHPWKTLNNILVTFPRDALFQVSTGDLKEIAMGILSLQERQRPRLFLFKDSFNRFFSCFVYIPKEKYTPELKVRIQKLLVEAFNGTEVEFDAQFTESILARLWFVIHIAQAAEVDYDPKVLEQQIVDATLTWEDGLREALIERYGEVKATTYYQRYQYAFPSGFKDDAFPRTAATDIERIENAIVEQRLGLHFYRPILETDERVHFRLYSVDRPVPLSDVIPILENMGLSVFAEHPYQINPQAGEVWIHDFTMLYKRGGEQSEQAGVLFQEAFIRIWEGQVENDGFNQLVLGAELSWKKVVMLRACYKYLKQIGIPFSQSYVIESLSSHPKLVRSVVELFMLRFDPQKQGSELELKKQSDRIEKQLDTVSHLDQDRIIRRFVNLVEATLRTNYFQAGSNGGDKEILSFKIDSTKVDSMPLPRPMVEIWVYSPRMEGVHLRGGMVARGGLRWSDRMEDFRTEVLGLMKAQMVKNTVIVPVGSKGGFIVKKLPSGDRQQQMEEVVRCYKGFLRGLLDLTDNLNAGKTIPPQQAVRYDGDDPYLVIAADKGTASFSDIANSVSAEYGFWLGDAFASGGSDGYDHKKMAITAKGAWESVKRNFRELGVDIQKTDFSVIGIGDMAGDVFGNGMLLSRHIRLIGAFNHLHIFLDPDPDPEVAYLERERLFQLPRSSWKDYDKRLISAGGGLYSRGAKSIAITDEVKAALGIKLDRMTPNELIHTMLKAPVDLLWNGGIGTYVKAASESHSDAQDRANDSLRVNGAELRCKVAGEGGNLGFTQLGRIEYAKKGGQIYSDFIDNSAGVDCSDHEVNIKILLGQVVSNGEMTMKQRNRLLEEMTGEVACLVLSDNYNQTESLSMFATVASEMLFQHARFMTFLEQEGRLNRALEYLPDSKEIAQRQAEQKGLTKPELATLLSYSKMTFYNGLIVSEVPDDEFLETVLHRYFPAVLCERFKSEMLDHYLKREIITTFLTNSIINHLGPGIGFRMREELGADFAGVTRAYLAAMEIFNIAPLWHEIRQLDNQVSAQVQIEMMRIVTGLLEKTIKWLLRNRRHMESIREQVDYFHSGVGELAESIPKPLAAHDRLNWNRQVKKLVNEGVPRALAQSVVSAVPLTAAMDIVELAIENRWDVSQVAALYFGIGAALSLHWLREQVSALSVRSHWHTLAYLGLIDNLRIHQRHLTADVLHSVRPSNRVKSMINKWIEQNKQANVRHTQIIADLKAQTSVDFAMLSVVINAVGDLFAKEKHN